MSSNTGLTLFKGIDNMEKREIKFRAWHKDAEEMLLWDRLKNLRMAIESENVLLMQYTGLKDKNGKEIYEGDVVKWYPLAQGEVVGVIHWEQQACQYWIKWVQVGKERNINRYEPIQAFYGDTEKYMDTRVEIIGNIYQDPHLLNN